MRLPIDTNLDIVSHLEKNPKLRNRQGQYIVLSQEGRVLKRGHELATVLRVLELSLVK